MSTHATGNLFEICRYSIHKKRLVIMEKYRMNGKVRESHNLILGQIAIVLVICFAIARNSSAQEGATAGGSGSSRNQARYLFERGVDYYRTGRYEQALESFQQAYNVRPSPAVRVNIANCYDQMNRPLEAIFHFERFLSESDINANQRREVEVAVKRLRGKVGEVTIQVIPEGASVLIDSGQRRQAPLAEAVPMIAGKHTIDVTHPDYRAERREIDVQGGKPMAVSIILRSETPDIKPGPLARAVAPETKKPPANVRDTQIVVAEEFDPDASEYATPQSGPQPSSGLPEAEPIPEPPRRERHSGHGPAVVFSGVLTAGLAIATGVVGVMALNANSKYKELAADWHDDSLSAVKRAKSRVEANTKAASAKNLARGADILLATTAVGAVVTLFLAVLWPDSHERRTARTVLPFVGSSSAGVSLTSAF